MKNTNIKKNRKSIILAIIFINILLIPSISQILTNFIPNNRLDNDFKPKLSAPTIVINSPNANNIFGSPAPDYNVTITDGSGVSVTWYELNNGTDWSTNYTFSGSTGSINEASWDFFGNGTVTITFYANNTLSEESLQSVIVRKDIVNPSIDSINSPTSSTWFNSTPPSYSLSITEVNLDEIWYTLDSGVTNYTGALSGAIDSTAWSNAGQGAVTITFYVNDSASNLDSASVGINRDTIGPSLDSIDSPSSGAWFNSTPPSYSLSITESNIDEIWYTLDSGVTNYTGALSGAIDSTAWSNAGQGAVTITFYVNDSASNLDSASVGINRDTVGPSLDSIDSPSSGAWFNSTPPSYSLSITESNIDEIWYTLDSGVTNYTGALSGAIDLTAWSNAGQGAVTITFYVNDSAGNWDSSSVGINRDTVGPSLDTIDSPSPGAWFNSTPPSYSLSITESNIDDIWYTLDSGVTNYTGALSGIIDPTAWSNAGQGAVTITFYVNDSAGNWDSASVGINRDTVDPSLDSIDSPSSGVWFNSTPPSYSLSITESNIDEIWYTLDSGVNNYTGALNGIIDSTAWSNAGQGAVTITFYVNDSAGNWDSASVGINRDTVGPSLDSIDSPSSGAWFNSTPPSYSLSITESNIDEIWYTLDSGVNNYTGALNGIIDSTAWSNAGQGAVTITFYVNDSAGNWDSASVAINRDTIGPSLDSIDTPSSGVWFNSTAPSYSLSITESNIDEIWYTLDSGVNNYTGALGGIIDSTAWSNAGQGSVTITFYVNDSASNLDSASVVINRDTVGPSLDSIDSPSSGAWFNSTPPGYSLSITESNIDEIWYTLDSGINNYTGALGGTIDSTAWSNAGQGVVTITFYINDSVGSWDSASVVINRDSVGPSLDSIDTPSSGAWFNSTPPSYSLSITESNIDEIWYTLDSGVTNYTGALSGAIDSTAWSNAGQGAVTITFYVNDSAGNWDSASVGINRDTVGPSLDSIDLPSSGAWFNSTPPTYSLSITESNIDEIWYTLDSGVNNYTGALGGTIDSTAWSNAGQGAVTVTFYVNDSVGSWVSASVGINRDTVVPSIDSIDSPSSGGWFNSTRPSYNLSITESNIYEIWYTLDSGVNNYTGALSGVIDSTAWSNAGQGAVTITFYVNDSASNLDSASVGINRDTINPSLDSIDSPLPASSHSTPPSYSLSITESNIDEIWYTLDSGVNNYTGALGGTIDPTAWGNAGLGAVTITFYVNDSASNWDAASVGITKTSDLSVSINSPSTAEWFGSIPNYDVSVSGNDRDTIWYTIDGGINNYTITSNANSSSNWLGAIDSTAWTNAGQGSVTVTFYLNSTFGITQLDSVQVNKDTVDPSIDNINSPLLGSNHSAPPSYSLSITESNIDEIWYTLNNGVNNYTGALAGTIDSTAWSNAGQGSVTITFYVNDSAGNWDSASVVINRDTIDPSLDSIDSPLVGEWFSSTAPSYSLSITESNIDEIWYTLNNGVNNYTGALAGTIDSTAWSNAGQGSVTITFYVNDSAGNWDSSSIVINRDTINPSLDSIDSPLVGEWFSSTPPTYSLSITESNINEIWYTLDSGVNNYTGALGGTIDSTAWSNAGQGSVTINFYVNDSVGSWDSASVVINRDIINPSLDSINSPIPASSHSTPPSYSLSITESNIDEIWYTLDSGLNNYTGALGGTIDSTAWGNAGAGAVTIIFYVNDSAGNWDSASVGIIKTLDLIITLNSPSTAEWFGSTPSYDVSLSGNNRDSLWYTIDGGINNFTITTNANSSTNWLGVIDSTAWANAGQGSVTITFYLNNTFGLTISDSVQINRDTVDPSLDSIDSPATGAWFNSTPPSYSLSITESNLSEIWYTLDSGVNNYTGALGGTIDSTAWSNAGQGAVTIIFYVNDSAGNWDSASVVINKDTVDPSIDSIDTPSPGAWFSSTPPTYSLSITEANLDEIWYTLDSGVNNYTGAIGGTIDSTAWSNAGQGVVTIRFYVNDTSANVDWTEVIVNKDTNAPIITINDPTPNQVFTHDIPTFNITVVEGNLNMTWYTLDGGLTNITFTGLTGTINQAAWILAPNGTVTIRFYANDTFGYLGFDDVSIQLNKFTPMPFNLSSTAWSPDTDGQFDLTWTISVGADNYSVYRVELNSSLTLIQAGHTDLNYSMSLGNGMYYFLVRSYNETGFTDSNQLMITVDIEITPEAGFDLLSFLTNPLTLINFGIMIGVLVGVILKIRKKYYKSGDKEIKRIEEIRRRKE